MKVIRSLAEKLEVAAAPQFESADKASNGSPSSVRMVELKKLVTDFEAWTGSTARVWRAPGRVNVIGDHTDYNEGFVLPIALNLRTYIAGSARADRKLRIRSLNLNETVSFDLSDQSPDLPRWASYIYGIARVIEDRGFRLGGADLLIDSEVPLGAGLSSSAALEIAGGLAMTNLAKVKIPPKELARFAQGAEHLYAGTRCGLMDQLAAAFGRADHALLIDCRSLFLMPVPLSLQQYLIVLCDTRVKHELPSSAYNDRRNECDEAVELLRKRLPYLRSLRDLDERTLHEHQHHLPELLLKRCRHVVTENERTLAAAEALSDGDIREVGQLMNRSHESLKSDFEVSSPESDAAVEIAQQITGVAGARMTGGGFGGVTINLVEADELNNFRETITRGYRSRFGFEPFIFTVGSGNGAEELVLDQFFH